MSERIMPNHMEARIRRAGPADVERIADVIAEAFHGLPPSRWLVPEADERAAILPRYFRLLLDHAVAHGEVQTVTGLAAAAVWFDETGGAAPEPAGYAARLDEICGRWADRFHVLDALLAAHRPARPHHHLAFLATQPGYQRGGLGTALLAHQHRHLDRYAIPAYLEAASGASRELYLRLGYADLGPAITLPGGPQLWPMWRRPVLAADDS
jgi:GNAT superfamily N-acetyltransferase